MSLKTKARRAVSLARHPAQGRVNYRGRGVVGLIDVGSVGRLPEPWHTNAPLLRRVLKFEPRDPAEQREDVVSVDAALWSATERRDFYIYTGGSGQGASLFRQNFDYVRAHYDTLRTVGPPQLAETWFERSELASTETVTCTTLDVVLAQHPGPYHLLKIDAQGAEKEILEGARGYLEGPDCVALHLELFRVPLYEGIALRPEVTAMVAEYGFEEACEFPPHGSFDSQNDVVFLRRGAAGHQVDVIRRAYRLSGS